MKVSIDYQIFYLQRYGGISRYFSRLFEYLNKDNFEINIVAPFYINYYLRELNSVNIHGHCINVIPYKTGRILNYGNQILGNLIASKIGTDVVHESYYSAKPTLNKKCKVRILTVYDMIHEKFANDFTYDHLTSLNKRAAVDRADHIICISQNTKNDLCEIFNVNPDKVSVTHLALDKNKNIESNFYQKREKPYLLYVGGRWGYKNFTSFIEAVSLDNNLKEEFDVIAFGGGEFTKNEKDLIKNLGFRNNSFYQIEGDDNLLNFYYKNATAFIYPSMYEGFGLPPLEAMALNCPVVCSNSSSIPEVVGDAGQYFEPLDIESQLEAIRKVVFDTSNRNLLINEGIKRLANFSWDKCASETKEIYNKVLIQKS